jgi:hypothetical protein
MKTVQLTGDHVHMIDGVHRTADSGPIDVVDEVANSLVQLGHAEVVPTGLEANIAVTNPYADAVSPLVPDADPLHAARMLGKVIEDHPGLVALADNAHALPTLAELPEAVGKGKRLKTVAVTTEPAADFTNPPKGD